jgi:hypothetical protein
MGVRMDLEKDELNFNFDPTNPYGMRRSKNDCYSGVYIFCMRALCNLLMNQN